MPYFSLNLVKISCLHWVPSHIFEEPLYILSGWWGLSSSDDWLSVSSIPYRLCTDIFPGFTPPLNQDNEKPFMTNTELIYHWVCKVQMSSASYTADKIQGEGNIQQSVPEGDKTLEQHADPELWILSSLLNLHCLSSTYYVIQKCLLNDLLPIFSCFHSLFIISWTKGGTLLSSCFHFMFELTAFCLLDKSLLPYFTKGLCCFPLNCSLECSCYGSWNINPHMNLILITYV